MHRKIRLKSSRSGGARKQKMKVALVGNQNSGKTTLFNYLTGMNAKIGNWPGVTIEKKTGIIKGTKHEITDLPGIYSLSPYSIEEDVARKFVLEENPDVIINLVDATSLERSLYLTTQLLELDTKIIIALNMVDVLEKKGIIIEEKKLEQEIGTKVCKISALKETGIEELIKQIDKKEVIKRKEIFDTKIENTVKLLQYQINDCKHSKFIAVKLLENDPRLEAYQTKEVKEIAKSLDENYDTDLEEIIATQRYGFIEKIKKKAVVKKTVQESISDKLDKVFLNKWIAFPIFMVIMFLVYYLSVGVVGSSTVDLINQGIDGVSQWLSDTLEAIGTSEMLKSLVLDGIVAGVGAVLGFVPQLMILFLCISLLETTGYMSRIALLLDRIFRKIGLSGKSLIPFIVGSGCSVPGIMGTRIIENQDEREMTTILTPFIPCSAKLPIIALFSGYFFQENAGIVSASLYFFAIAIIIVSAFVLSKIKFKSTSSTFISELPEYKLPSAKYIAKEVGEKVSAFIKRAGSVIFICSIVIWFLLSFSFQLEYGVEIKDSMLAVIGKTISWVFYPILGENNWGATVSAIQGLVAKEQVVSSMAVIAGFDIFAKGTAFASFTKASAYAFMVFNLFSAPCFGAIGAMRRELGSTKKLLKTVCFQTILAWCLATIVYQVGSRLEKENLSIADVLIIVAIFLFVLFIILENRKRKAKGCATCPYSNSCKKK